MGKRNYAYFRDPSGRAAGREDVRHAPTLLLQGLGEQSFLNNEGGVSWHAGFADTLHHKAMTSSIVLQDQDGVELSGYDSERLVWRALVDVAKVAPGKPILPATMLDALDKVVGAFVRQVPNPYILVTSISVDKLPKQQITVQSHKIAALELRGPSFPLPKVLTETWRKFYFADHLSRSKYQTVSVSTSGRTHFEAAHRALNAVSLLRAAWSLPATRGTLSFSFVPGRRPIGVIHGGPVHTLHNPDGTLYDAEDGYWYEPDYREDQDVFRGAAKWPALEKFRGLAFRTIRTQPYGRDLADLLIRYVSALDQANPNVAFLQMWSILEKITDTVGSNYDETIARAKKVFVEKDRPLVKELLGALRHNRNRMVHAGLGHEDAHIVYLLKRFVDPHLLRLVRNDYRVSSLKEYAEYLTLPTDDAELKKRIARLSRLLQYNRKQTKP